MHETIDIFDKTISFQENTWTDVCFELNLKTVLDDIKSDKYKQQVTDLRTNLENGNTNYYDSYKRHLPAVTFCATFNTNRTKENLKNYNNLMILDIDKLNAEEIEVCYNYLFDDEFVLSFWRSPSNKGYKGLVQIEFLEISNEIDIDKKHKIAFKKISTYFLEKYNLILDKSGSDISRLCYLSYDSNLVKKENSNKFQITTNDINLLATKPKTKTKRIIKFVNNKDALYNPLDRNNKYNRKLMTDIIRYLTNKKKSITHSYEEWFKVAMAIANTFTFDVGLNYFTKLSRLDSVKFNELHCTNFLISCYESKNGNINFASIIHLANEKGYSTKQQKLTNGVPKVEI